MKVENANNKRVIVIDNYDSFTYNLVHIIQELLDKEIDVVRNDEVNMASLEEYDYIILSPGPGIPDEAGDLKKVIEVMGPKKKMLGVCLGLQAIGEVYGARLKNLDKVFHGMSTPMYLTADASPIFSGIEDGFEAGRYHSWVIDNQSDTSQLVITCKDEKAEIMAAHHKDHQIYGVQFHPESIMTPEGKKMIYNFLNL